MTTIRQVREAMAAAITAGAELPGSAVDGAVPNSGTFQVVRGAYDPRFVFSGTKQMYPFKVRVFAGVAANDANVRLLDEYAEAEGDRSIVAAVQNGTLWPDGLVDYAQVVQVSEVALASYPEAQFLMVEFDVEVVW